MMVVLLLQIHCLLLSPIDYSIVWPLFRYAVFSVLSSFAIILMRQRKLVALLDLRNRSAPAVNCCVIIHCLEVSCKEDQITSAQREWFIFVQLTDKQ